MGEEVILYAIENNCSKDSLNYISSGRGLFSFYFALGISICNVPPQVAVEIQR